MSESIKEKSAKERILELLFETLDGSSIHSFPNMVKNKYKSIKLMWFIIFLASTGVCGYLITKSMKN